MKRFFGILGKIVRWYLVLILVIMMLAIGGKAVPFFGLTAILVAPIGKIKQLKQKLRISKKLNAGLIIALFFAGCAFAPKYEPEITLPEETYEALAENVEEIVESEIELTEKDVIESEIEEPDVEPMVIEEPVIEEQEIVIPEDSTFSIRFLDVGQADSTLIECDGHYMLIDGGNSSDSSKIYTILKESQIEHLDIIVGTHADEDHIGGLAGALNYATADITLCSTTEHDAEVFTNFAKYAEQNGGGIKVPEIGDAFLLGSSKVTILGVNGGRESNDTSIILKVEYGDTSFLFTGDAEGEAEQAVLTSGVDLSATVLKVGHHGSSDSTSDAFLNKVMPAYAIISVGRENTYLHPTDDTLDRLKNVNAEIYRTDLNGEITITSDSKTVSVVAEKEASEEEIMISGEKAAEIAREKAEVEAKVKAEAEAKAKEEAEAKAKATAKAKAEAEKKPTYTYSSLNTKMYATQSVNVRSLPSTSGSRLGGLAYAQEVSVTGKCNETGWYRIEYQGKEAFVSNSYLTSEKPVVQRPSKQQSSSSGATSSTGESSSSGTSSGVPGTDYIGNKNTGKFHYSGCSSVKRMKESNKFYYNGTRDEMIAMGYDPCGNCNP